VEIKPGWKTSEFWVMLAGGVLLAVQKHILPDLPVESILAVGAVLASYVIGRSLVKKV